MPPNRPFDVRGHAALALLTVGRVRFCRSRDRRRDRVDDGPTLPYNAPLTTSGFGRHTVRYHAVDRVNNRGEGRILAFFLDDQLPDISLTYSLPPIGSSPPLLPAGTILYIETADRGTEVEKVTYSFDGSKERLYRSRLSGFRAGFTFDLRVRAVDRLENLREYTVTLRSE